MPITILIRNTSGRIVEANDASIWLDHDIMAIRYKAFIPALPLGTWTHIGVRYPDGHETWVQNKPRDVVRVLAPSRWRKGALTMPLTLTGTISIS